MEKARQYPAMTVTLIQDDGMQTAPGDDTLIAVPSGQAVTLQEVVWNAPGPDGLALRFRFVAPAIASGGGVDIETAHADMLALCQTYAIPRMADYGPQVQQIIISLADRQVTFGATEPDATQFFEAYRVEDGICIWEMY
jgi:Family of unknown function (DUF6497)